MGAVHQDGSVTATIHNLGNASAEDITVRLLDGETVLQDQVINRLEAPADFVARRKTVTFDNFPVSRYLNVVIDPANEIQEILTENNRARIPFFVQP